MLEQLEADLPRLLSAIELREMRLLGRGVHGARFSEDELLTLIAENFPAANAGKYLKQLLDGALVVNLPDGGYRSRMAETIHLLATLRQLFPGKPWWSRPDLVLDFRALHRPRRRPDRTEEDRRGLLAVATADLASQVLPALEVLTPKTASGFQKRSAEAVRSSLNQDCDAGVVVSAGTGSGKTLAFYLPAIAWILDSIQESPDFYVRALALYPRTELLKDQLKTALGHSLRMSDEGKDVDRPLRIGAWFGKVPVAAQWVEKGWSGWKQRGAGALEGWECPYIDCPSCEVPLLWLRADLKKKREKLVCTNCDFILGADRVALTRDSATKRPPDIMFTTTESVNRQLASPDSGRAFGLTGKRRVRIVLLDEVHTYEGITGAQNAFLLRRLKNAIGSSPVLWAGLSATLIRAQEFFASFVGIPQEDVVVTGPEASELVESGAEYLLALRHNPTSNTGPLSATIQTAMALQRCLDAKGAAKANPFGPSVVDSGGLFGSRTFVFTDKLDVTNRLYWDLLDAEGWWDEGKPITKRLPTTLAHIRSENQGRIDKAGIRSHAEERLPAGQFWWMPQELGHDIDADRPLRVGRTSSQDQGVSDADVIIATATLEVGYDDDRVGAVIQHKAPHDAARFLQRKGRAGRNIAMRPWTVVVLSDWGRDRFAWQAYDQLFDPKLEATCLPLSNRYVQRMQAVYSSLDWLAAEVARTSPDRNAWKDLSGPATTVEKKANRQQERSQRQMDDERLLAEVLDGGPARQRLTVHLERALDLSTDQIEALLWTPPRPLMLSVLPTAHRRLKLQWEGELQRSSNQQISTPLPEFIAGALFADLLTPEVEVCIPTSGGKESDKKVDFLPVVRVLNEFMPGNVTRHFGVNSFSRRHWIDLPEPDLEGIRVAKVETYGPQYLRSVPSGCTSVHVYLPQQIELEIPPQAIRDSSSVTPVWENWIESIGGGSEIALSPAWTEILPQIRFHVHAEGDGVRMCRFARQAVGSLKRDLNDDESVTISFSSAAPEESHAALGVESEVDGVCLTAAVPLLPAVPSATDRSLRLGDIVHGDPSLLHLNGLTKTALISALLVEITKSGDAGVIVAKSNRDLSLGLDEALQQLGLLDDAARPVPNPGDSGEGNSEEEKLVSLRACIQQDQVLNRLRSALLEASQQVPDAGWHAWHRSRVGVATAAMFVEAASRLLPAFDPSGVAIDLALDEGPVDADSGATNFAGDCVSMWITETSPGGNGLIEGLHLEISRSSADFRQLLAAATRPTDLEILDSELQHLLQEWAPSVEQAVALVRSSWESGHDAVEGALEGLQFALANQGQSLSYSALSFLATRLAGQGAPDELGPLLRDLIERWQEFEKRTSFAIDARVFGAACSTYKELDERLGQSFEDPQRRARSIAGFFWPRGLDALEDATSNSVSFSRLPVTNIGLLRDVVPEPWPVVECESDLGVNSALAGGLAEHGALDIRFPDADAARGGILAAVSNPVEVDGLLIYPRVTGIDPSGNGVKVSFSAKEVGL